MRDVRSKVVLLHFVRITCLSVAQLAHAIETIAIAYSGGIRVGLEIYGIEDPFAHPEDMDDRSVS